MTSASRSLICSSGNVYAYSAYGETAVLGPDGGNALRYTGREDDGNGLFYYRARYYDPVLKRFVSEDPIGLEAGTNFYPYVLGDPISLTDPKGEFAGNAFSALLSAGANFTYQAYTNYQLNGGNVLNSLQCVNLSSVVVSGAIGFVFPGAIASSWRSIKVATRGASAKRAAASVVLTGTVAVPSSLVLSTALPAVPLNRIVPTFGTNCTCASNP